MVKDAHGRNVRSIGFISGYLSILLIIWAILRLLYA